MTALLVAACGDAAELDHARDSETFRDSTAAAVDTTSAADPCPVLEDDSCPDDCIPIVSMHLPSMECSPDGVLLGCAAPYTGSVSLDTEYICAVLRSDPQQRYFCVEDEDGVRWFYDHQDLFCVGDPPCTGTPMCGVH